MSESAQAADRQDRRGFEIGGRLRRFFGREAVQTAPLDPADLGAVLAFRALTSFIGLPTPTLVPAFMASLDSTDAPESGALFPSCFAENGEAFAPS